jgi:hypothetical protein
MKPHEQIAEREIQGIGLPGAQRERPGAGLECRAIAEVEAGDERGVVTQERNRRQRRGD